MMEPGLEAVVTAITKARLKFVYEERVVALGTLRTILLMCADQCQDDATMLELRKQL